MSCNILFLLSIIVFSISSAWGSVLMASNLISFINLSSSSNISSTKFNIIFAVSKSAFCLLSSLSVVIIDVLFDIIWTSGNEGFSPGKFLGLSYRDLITKVDW